MHFDSLQFGVFLLALWTVYQFLPQRLRWLALLLASLWFYAALNAPLLLVALGLVTAVAFLLGRSIHREQRESARALLLWAGIAANIAILGSVKYLHPLLAAISPSSIAELQRANLFVTIGVSYYTLQAISYVVDVYLGRVEPEHHFGRFALYLGYFPKLLQGPIERAEDLLPQLTALRLPDYAQLRMGAVLFAWGLFKKVAVADRLAPYVDAVYGDVKAHSGISFLMATYMYALQIYADFSGYTDMALGVALLFGIRLTQNFRMPYLARSVAEFWRRWHISFSRWILDYVFRPLQISWRGWGGAGTAAALVVTFLFSGLWHGVSWGFVVWGLLHGVYLATSTFWTPRSSRIARRYGVENHRLRKAFQVFVTFQLVCLAWIFFRAPSVSDAWYVVTNLHTGVGAYVLGLLEYYRELPQHRELVDPILLGKTLPRFLLLLAALVLWGTVALLQHRFRIQERPAWIRWPAYYLLVAAIAFLAVHDDVGFVYFQF
jgi:D-alanyl-lipoteichoic acid acyltransferase DltB (MBOAT superfamily)